MKTVTITITVPTEWEDTPDGIVVDGFRANPAAWKHTVHSKSSLDEQVDALAHEPSSDEVDDLYYRDCKGEPWPKRGFPGGLG